MAYGILPRLPMKKPRHAVEMWTNGMGHWTEVQALLRGYEYPWWHSLSFPEYAEKVPSRTKFSKSNATEYGIKMVMLMARYFLQQALRAPMVPPRESPDGSLYRGIRLTAPQTHRMMSALETLPDWCGGNRPKNAKPNIFWTDRGFMAWSAQPKAAGACSTGIILVLDRKTGVSRGTPWVWYGKPRGRGKGTVAIDKVRSRHGPTSEILMPPGRLAFLCKKSGTLNYEKVTYVFVEYQPDMKALRSLAHSRKVK